MRWTGLGSPRINVRGKIMILSPVKPRPIQVTTFKNDRKNSKGEFGDIKLQKGPKPLKDKQFYLDIKNHSISLRFESSIKEFGGVIAPFLGKEVNIVVTDRPEWKSNGNGFHVGSPLNAGHFPKPSPSPSPLPCLFSPAASPAGHSRGSNASPTTLDSPGEINYGGGRRFSKSRTEAMLERARGQPHVTTRDPLADAQSWGIPIWQIEKTLRFLQKISSSLKGQLSSCAPKGKVIPHTQKVKYTTGHFLKIESASQKFKPYYRELPFWPKIDLNCQPGCSPFILKPQTSKDVAKKAVTKAEPVRRQSPRKKSSPRKQLSHSKTAKTVVSPKKTDISHQSEFNKRLNCVPRPPSKRHPNRATFIASKKEGPTKPAYEPLTGYCEICKVDFSDIRAHVKTDVHKKFTCNDSHYASLDKLIDSKALNIDTISDLVSVNGERNSSGVGSSTSTSERVVAAPQTLEESSKKNPSKLGTAVDVADNDDDGDVNMRQPVDERPCPAKMVGRKETLEVQCNGISNHIQTRFACTKGDRENLGGIYLDEQIGPGQLRKRRAISVSCNLLEISSSTGERAHFLRSGRSTRSELCQLSPALSDNSHPLLNSNNQQPLISPALSDKSHLRTRSQLWVSSNHIEDGPTKVTNGKVVDSLLVAANSCSEKISKGDNSEGSDRSEKLDRNEKTSKSDKVSPDGKSDTLVKDDTLREKLAREVHEHSERIRTRNHSKSRSIKKKRLSAEEKLIEDNRGYYKVEVLNSKLRSTGYFVSQSSVQDEEFSNGRHVQDDQETETDQNGDLKEPVVVRFRKVRRSELSVLSDEAENFMFGEQVKSESNSGDSSDFDEDDDEDDDGLEDDVRDGNGSEDNCGSRSSQRHRRRTSGSIAAGSRRFRLKFGGTRLGSGEDSSIGNASNNDTNGHQRLKKRRTQAEAFINDNMDYYKFEMAGSRLRPHETTSTVPDESDGVKEGSDKKPGLVKIKTEEKEKEKDDDDESDKVYACPVDKLHFSFESVPRSEVWYQTFQRQDSGDEFYFPLISEPSSVLLPYQIPRNELGLNQKFPLGKRRANQVRLPRKSPRCHASTLAILSSIVRRRNKDPEKIIPIEETSAEVTADAECKSMSHGRKNASLPSSSSEPSVLKSEPKADLEDDIQEIAKNIDEMLGFDPLCPIEKDQVVERKVCGKGRKRKLVQKVVNNVNNASSSSDNVPVAEREKDPTLNYLVDPVILEELSCTCDVVSNPRGGPAMDILSLLESYTDCRCTADYPASAERSVDASCNSSECGTSSTCDFDRRMRKKRKRRNMTGWDKPKRKSCKASSGVQSAEDIDTCVQSVSDAVEEVSGSADLDCQSRLPSEFNSLPKRKGVKRKLRSSSSLNSSPYKGKGRGRKHSIKKVIRVLDNKNNEQLSLSVSATSSKRSTFRKIRRIGLKKVR